jgi:hypothetical protein
MVLIPFSNNLLGHYPIQLLAIFLFRGQKKTGNARLARRSYFLDTAATPCQSMGLRGPASGIFRAGIAAASGAHDN